MKTRWRIVLLAVLVVFCVACAFGMWVLQCVQNSGSQAVVSSRLHEVGLALTIYHNDHDRFPDNLERLLDDASVRTGADEFSKKCLWDTANDLPFIYHNPPKNIGGGIAVIVEQQKSLVGWPWGRKTRCGIMTDAAGGRWVEGYLDERMQEAKP